MFFNSSITCGRLPNYVFDDLVFIPVLTELRMSDYQELSSAKYYLDECNNDGPVRGPRTRTQCNQSAESLMIWGFFAVAMCAIVLMTQSQF